MSRFDSKRYGIITPKDLKTSRVKALYFTLLIFMMVVCLLCIVPPLWIVLSSFKDIKEIFQVPPTIIPKTFHPEKIAEVWNKMKFSRYVLNSGIVIVGNVVCTIVFNGLLAYVISTIKPKGSRLVFLIILWSTMIPSSMSMVPLFKNIIAMNQINSFIPLWLMGGASAFYILLFKSFFDSIPHSYIEAARLDGASYFSIFTRIVLPMSKAVIAVVSILTVNAVWSEFIWAFLILKRQDLYTVMVRLYTLTKSYGNIPINVQMIAISFGILPPAVIFIFLQRHIVQGISLSGIKG
jgi:multiple sugar transport system permease protein